MGVNVAVFGINGLLGGPVLEALTTTPFGPKVALVKAITRSQPKEKWDKVDYIVADITKADDQKKIVDAIKGVDVIIGLNAPDASVYSGLEAIIPQVKPKLYVPSQFGAELAGAQKVLPGFLQPKVDHSNKVRKDGIKVVDVSTGLFIVPGSFAYEFVPQFGINAEDATVTQRGDPNTPISVSALEDVGKVVASIATTADYSKLPDSLRVRSDQVTFTEVQETWSNNHGKKLNVVKQLSLDEAREEAADIWGKGFDPSKFGYYLQAIASQGSGKGLVFESVNNDLVNPGTWEWTKFKRNTN